MKRVIVPFFIAHHGCPHQCVFCNQLKIAGADRELPNQKDILSRISSYRDFVNGNALEVAFYGGTFTSLPFNLQKKLLQPLQSLIKANLITGVRISTRPDSIDRHGVAFLREMGVTTVELGVQSLDDEVLALAGRGHSAACVEESCLILREGQLSVGLQLMPGLPGDSPEKSLATLSRALLLLPAFLRIYPTLVITGTPLANLYRSGSYAPMSLDAAVVVCKVMLHKAAVAGIPVIRLGLQPTDELQTPGVVLAGPFHPAFRQLVESELCFDLLSNVLGEFKTSKNATVYCAPARISDVVGHGKSNIEKLVALLGIKRISPRADVSLSRHEFIVEVSGNKRNVNLLRDLEYF
jgi:histone acetyltransferase (RNA polymerase elongator complex component)